MNRKLTGLAAAGVFALVGTLILVGYVRSAEARALSGEKLVDVLVVTDAIEAGTPAEDLADSISTEQVPEKVRADGAITDLSAVKGLVTTVDLVPGEQLVTDRFAAKASHAGVPEGLLEVTVRLDPERALGGEVAAGDRVAVFASFDPFEIDASGTGISTDANVPKKTPNMTHLTLHQVVVTNVQLATAPATTGDDGDDDTLTVAPTGGLFVTLAVSPEDAQRVVFTAEHGFLWLAAEPTDASQAPTVIETLGTVNR